MENHSITAPVGFEAYGIACGIKTSGHLDLGLITCCKGTRGAAVFTTNRIQAAPVQVSKQHLKRRDVRAVIVNSGNANACTGQEGLNDARTMCRCTAEAIGCRPDQVWVASTGIIGQRLPIETVTNGIHRMAGEVSGGPEGGRLFSESIMTTDTRCKQACLRVELGGHPVTLAGTIKGAGMIGPNMATTLSFLTTDAVITKACLKTALREAVGQSMNKLTVDGHQSTNDTAFLLASGRAGHAVISERNHLFSRLTQALHDLCGDLVRQMAFDAEGATRIFTVVVKGAATRRDAARVARAIADYDLVKCAVHGGDPNWGRIICAVGSSSIKIVPDRLSCALDNLVVFHNGSPTSFDREMASRIVSQDHHTITVDLGMGKDTDFCYGVDLSREYVAINADYHT